MRKKLAYAAAAIAVAALVVSNPVVAEAARKITGADIRNGTVRSPDLENRTIKAKDVATNTLKSWDITNETIRSKDVRDGSLQATDFTAGTLPVTAYARVTAGAAGATLDSARSQNVATVTRTANGVYCLELAAAVDRNVAVVAAPEGGTAGAGNDTAMYAGNCGANGIQVHTQEQSVVADALVSAPANDVAFSVLVP